MWPEEGRGRGGGGAEEGDVVELMEERREESCWRESGIEEGMEGRKGSRVMKRKWRGWKTYGRRLMVERLHEVEEKGRERMKGEWEESMWVEVERR